MICFYLKNYRSDVAAFRFLLTIIDYRGFEVKDLWKLKEMKIEFDFRKAGWFDWYYAFLSLINFLEHFWL